MKSLLVIAALVACTLGAPGPSSKVYGGGLIDEFEFPFLLTFQRLGTISGVWDHLCGASLIRADWVLLSAACLRNIVVSRTRVGGAEYSFDALSGREEYRGIDTIYIHPDYNNPGPNYNDLALLHLSLPFNLVNSAGYIGTIDLPAPGQEYEVGTNLTVAGWGPSGPSGLTSIIARKASNPTIAIEECRSSYGSSVVVDGMMCTGRTSSSIGPCGEDLGGPLFSQNPFQLVGIYSWDWGCNLSDYPPVYTQVSLYMDWISSIIDA